MLDASGVPVNGSCAAGFERVRDAFTSNFTDGDDVGAAVAVWVEGDLSSICGVASPTPRACGHGEETP